MKAIVLSDTHGIISPAANAIMQDDDISLIIFAGDMHRDVQDLMNQFPNIPCVYVLGNNDWFVHDVPYDKCFSWGGKKFFLTHGHKYGVKTGLLCLRLKASELGADICIFGHTHQSLCLNENGILLLNPGTAAMSCGIIEIGTDGNLKAEITRI